MAEPQIPIYQDSNSTQPIDLMQQQPGPEQAEQQAEQQTEQQTEQQPQAPTVDYRGLYESANESVKTMQGIIEQQQQQIQQLNNQIGQMITKTPVVVNTPEPEPTKGLYDLNFLPE